MNIWLWVLAFFLGFLFGFFMAAIACAARLSDEENDRLRAHIAKNYPEGKGDDK